jgi:hypothetical protein
MSGSLCHPLLNDSDKDSCPSACSLRLVDRICTASETNGSRLRCLACRWNPGWTCGSGQLGGSLQWRRVTRSVCTPSDTPWDGWTNTLKWQQSRSPVSHHLSRFRKKKEYHISEITIRFDILGSQKCISEVILERVSRLRGNARSDADGLHRSKSYMLLVHDMHVVAPLSTSLKIDFAIG